MTAAFELHFEMNGAHHFPITFKYDWLYLIQTKGERGLTKNNGKF